LRAIGFNGGTSARIGQRQLAGLTDPPRFVALPSSSPAYTRTFEEKKAQWMRLREFL
jgi:G:T/U-mismatch repair DNA glycosylase